MNRFLGAVRTAIRRVSDERSVIESPILVGDELASNGPVETRIYGRQVAGFEIRVRSIPGSGSRQQQRQSRRIHPEGIDQILRWRVEPTARKVARRIREIQPLPPVRVACVGLAVFRRGLKRKDGLWSVHLALERSPDLVKAGFQPIRAVSYDILERRDSVRVLVVIKLDASLVGLGGPHASASLVSVTRCGREQLDRRVEILQKIHGNRAGVLIRLTEIGFVLAVVGDVAPHPPSLEVVVRSQKNGFSRDGLCIRGRKLRWTRGQNRFQEAKRGIGSDHAFVDYNPLAVQVVRGEGATPVVGLDGVDIGLVADVRSLVGIAARNAPPYPVAGRASPTEIFGLVGTVQRSIRCDEGSFDARAIRERRLIQRPLWRCRVAQEILAAIQKGYRKN